MSTANEVTLWPFSIFGGCNGTARALNRSPSTVQYWVQEKRIPQARWDEVIQAAAKVGETITADDLHNMTQPAQASA